LDLRQLKYFLALAEAQNFHVAADALGLTQSALTQSIAKLERDLEVELFIRSSSGTVLTGHGKRLRHHAQVILAQVQAAETELTARAGHLGMEISVGVVPVFPDALLMRLLERLQNGTQGRRIKLVKEWSAELIPMLERGTIDFAFVSDHFLAEPVPEITRTVLFQDQVRAVVGQPHPLYDEPEVALAQLAEYEWVAVSLKSEWTEFLAQVFAAIDLPPPSRIIQTNSATLAVELIGNGLAVGLVSAKTLRAASDYEYRFFDIPELRQQRIFSLCQRTRMVLQPWHREFVRVFEEVVREEFRD
jgi:DNA-binding transcriptional LysR family regulator